MPLDVVQRCNFLHQTEGIQPCGNPYNDLSNTHVLCKITKSFVVHENRRNKVFDENNFRFSSCFTFQFIYKFLLTYNWVFFLLFCCVQWHLVRDATLYAYQEFIERHDVSGRVVGGSGFYNLFR